MHTRSTTSHRKHCAVAPELTCAAQAAPHHEPSAPGSKRSAPAQAQRGSGRRCVFVPVQQTKEATSKHTLLSAHHWSRNQLGYHQLGQHQLGQHQRLETVVPYFDNRTSAVSSLPWNASVTDDRGTSRCSVGATLLCRVQQQGAWWVTQHLNQGSHHELQQGCNKRATRTSTACQARARARATLDPYPDYPPHIQDLGVDAHHYPFFLVTAPHGHDGLLLLLLTPSGEDNCVGGGGGASRSKGCTTQSHAPCWPRTVTAGARLNRAA